MKPDEQVKVDPEKQREDQWNEERIKREKLVTEQRERVLSYLKQETEEPKPEPTVSSEYAALEEEELADLQRHHDPRALAERLRRAGL